jgi:hypothetical protein
MSLRNLGLRISNPPVALATKVHTATESAIPPLSPIDDKVKEREVSMEDSESVVSGEPPPLPSHEPYWVTDIESSAPPPVDETLSSPPSTPKHPEEEPSEHSTEESSDGQHPSSRDFSFPAFRLPARPFCWRSTRSMAPRASDGSSSADWHGAASS